MFRTLVILLAACLFATGLQAAPKAELWQRWDQADAAATQTIDHARWDTLLQRYLVTSDDGVNRFAYGRVSDADRAELDAYIESLAQLPILDFRREQQMAYWINLYNALTVQEILRFYPLDSIRDISSGLFSSGPWKKELVEVDGEALTLDDIEHRILRPIWRDPRIHYAVNCASIGCPNLQPQAFTAANTEALLERGAREFVNHPRGARVVDGDLEVSSIYAWFEEDFGGNDAGVIAHLRQYADAELQAALAGIERIDDDDYDWSINTIQ
ncbi:MAG: DUF547 domain-containing protein [Gammaproteobacteria bacterium]|nr:DUF547 domain-containing protein [Gammaproteobacteria bacterium]